MEEGNNKQQDDNRVKGPKGLGPIYNKIFVFSFDQYSNDKHSFRPSLVSFGLSWPDGWNFIISISQARINKTINLIRSTYTKPKIKLRKPLTNVDRIT